MSVFMPSWGRVSLQPLRQPATTANLANRIDYARSAGVGQYKVFASDTAATPQCHADTYM
jgi:hypothetical protein